MKWMRFRAFLVLFFLFGGFCLVLARALQIQLAPDERLLSFVASKSHWTKKKAEAELLKSRGSVLDRNENVMALSLISKSFFANPRLIDQPQSVAKKLAPHLNLNARQIEELLSNDRFFVWLEREVDHQRSQAIESLEIPGLHSSKESRRVHPHQDLARDVLGIVGRDHIGLEGLELQYDRWLKVSDESVNWGIRDALGRGLRFQDYQRQWFDSHDLVLTIDLRLQKIVEEELQRAVKENEALSAQAIMMDPKTGAILAMSSWDGDRQETQPFFRNRTISDVFEPGSTFKIVVAMAALEKLHMSPSSQVYAEKGLLRIGNHSIREYNRRQFEWLTLTEMLAKSSNVAASKLGLQLGAGHFHDTIRRFGFGERTGIDLPGEAQGLLRAHRNWRPVELANISFGQGIAVTSLQMARAFSAIANGGFLVRPQVVERIQSPGQPHQVLWTKEVEREEVFRAEDARALKEMLLSVTEEGGTGRAAAIPGFRVAGKTGTSQKLVERETASGSTVRTYASDASIVSFGGFVPADDPAFVLFLMIDEPVARASGGGLAAPVWSKIARRSLGILGVGRELASSHEPLQRSEESLFVGMRFQDVLKEVRAWEEARKRKVELIGFGRAIREEVAEDRIRVYFE